MYLQNYTKGCRYFKMYYKYRSEWKNMTGQRLVIHNKIEVAKPSSADLLLLKPAI